MSSRYVTFSSRYTCTLPVTNNKPLHTEVTSFSETNSVDTSLLSEDGDIITIVTADRVTASVLHGDTDTSSISVDQEEEDIVTPLCSPTNSRQPADDNIVTVENVIGVDNIDIPQARTGDGGNKKSVRFQDSLHDHNVNPVLQSNSTAVAPDKVSSIVDLHARINFMYQKMWDILVNIIKYILMYMAL